MRLHGGRYGSGIESSGGEGFCMIAAEFGWNFMVLICCIGKGGGWVSRVTTRSWCAFWRDGIHCALILGCACVCCGERHFGGFLVFSCLSHVWCFDQRKERGTTMVGLLNFFVWLFWCCR